MHHCGILLIHVLGDYFYVPYFYLIHNSLIDSKIYVVCIVVITISRSICFHSDAKRTDLLLVFQTGSTCHVTVVVYLT